MARGNIQNRVTEEQLFAFFEESSSAEDREMIKHWLEEHNDNTKRFEELKVIYHWFKTGGQPGKLSKEDSWNRIRTGYYKSVFMNAARNKGTTPRKRWIRLAVPLAAAVVFAFLTGIIVQYLLDKGNPISSRPAYCEVFVPLGARSQVSLSDGTKVWLNANSRLRYPEQFDISREVTLEGEAYFDVANMKDKVFVVNTSDVRVKAYGTQFNVKSYTDEDLIQTTLVEGSVSVEPIKGNAKEDIVFLKPNQSLNFYKEGDERIRAGRTAGGSHRGLTERPAEKIVLLTRIDPLPITSWKDNNWVIKGESLGNLAVKLERRYNVKILFQDESIKKYKFSGILKEETFEQVLKILQVTMPIIFSVNDNEVIFSEDKSFKTKYDTMIQSPK